MYKLRLVALICVFAFLSVGSVKAQALDSILFKNGVFWTGTVIGFTYDEIIFMKSAYFGGNRYDAKIQNIAFVRGKNAKEKLPANLYDQFYSMPYTSQYNALSKQYIYTKDNSTVIQYGEPARYGYFSVYSPASRIKRSTWQEHLNMIDLSFGATLPVGVTSNLSENYISENNGQARTSWNFMLKCQSQLYKNLFVKVVGSISNLAINPNVITYSPTGGSSQTSFTGDLDIYSAQVGPCLRLELFKGGYYNAFVLGGYSHNYMTFYRDKRFVRGYSNTTENLSSVGANSLSYSIGNDVMFLIPKMGSVYCTASMIFTGSNPKFGFNLIDQANDVVLRDESRKPTQILVFSFGFGTFF